MNSEIGKTLVPPINLAIKAKTSSYVRWKCANEYEKHSLPAFSKYTVLRAEGLLVQRVLVFRTVCCS